MPPDLPDEEWSDQKLRTHATTLADAAKCCGVGNAEIQLALARALDSALEALPQLAPSVQANPISGLVKVPPELVPRVGTPVLNVQPAVALVLGYLLAERVNEGVNPTLKTLEKAVEELAKLSTTTKRTKICLQQRALSQKEHGRIFHTTKRHRP